MKKTLALILFILLMLPATSLASDSPNISAYFDTQTQDVIITGNGSPGDIIIIVSDPGNTDTFSNDNPPYDIISVANKDSYTVTITLAAKAAGKKLLVTATDKTGVTVSDEFIYPDFNGSSGIINELNSADSLREFMSIAKPNALKLGFNTETDIYQSSESDIYAIMYATKPTELTAIGVYDLFYVSASLASFKGTSEEETEKILKENSMYLGIDFDKDYNSDERLDENSKKTLCKTLSEENFAEILSPAESFGKYFEKAKALSRIKTAENYRDIKDVIETDFKNLFDFSSQAPATLQQIYSKMMSYTYSSFDDISSNYKKAVNEVASQSNSSSSSSGSFGGGGGGSVSLPSSVEVILSEDTAVEEAEEKKPMATLPADAQSTFIDVPSYHWSYEAVSALSTAGIISGYDTYTFKPDYNITRAEFTKLVCVSFGIPTLKANYTDVGDDAWYNGYVGGASKYGIINGYGETFAPNAPITRQDAAVIVYRALKNENIILSGSADFEDFNDISLYALTAVGAFREFGILSGDGTNFHPTNNITRAEAAKLLYKALSINN